MIVPAGLHIESDLRLQVGDSVVHLEADGSRLTARSDDVGRLVADVLAGVRSTDARARSARRALGLVAGELDDAGLTAEVVDAHGVFLELGHEVSTGSGRLLFGSSKVRLVRPRGLAGVVATLPAVRRRFKQMLIGVAVAAATARIAYRRVKV